MQSHVKNGPTWVYRIYCDHLCLLYVGVAYDVQRRLDQHRATKEWWPEVAQVQSDLFETRSRALKVEAFHIVYDNPKYNILEKLDRPKMPHPRTHSTDYVVTRGGRAVFSGLDVPGGLVSD